MDVKLAKACGHLPGVPLSDLGSEKIDGFAEAFFEKRLCGHPDHGDEEIADAEPDDISRHLECDEERAKFLKEAHARLTAWEATGRGSWPAGCYPDKFPNHHSCKVFLDFDSFPGHYTRPVTSSELDQILEAGTWGMTKEEIYDKWNGKPMLTVAMDLTNECYRIVGCAHIMTTDGPQGDHNVHIKAQPIPGGVIGFAYFNSQFCGDHVDQRIDSTWRPGLHSCAHLLAHECGHNHNLQHTFSNQNHHRGIMSYNSPRLFYGYSTGQSPHSLPLDPSLRVLKRYYGGEPVPVDDPTTPKPPTPPVEPESHTIRAKSREVNVKIVYEGGGEDPPIVF